MSEDRGLVEEQQCSTESLQVALDSVGINVRAEGEPDGQSLPLRGVAGNDVTVPKRYRVLPSRSSSES